MFGSPRGISPRTRDACTEERACVICKDPSLEEARRKERTAKPEEEDVSRTKAGEEEGGDQRGETSVDGGVREHRQPGPRPAKKSQGAAVCGKWGSKPRPSRDVAIPAL
ncbi:hypothetical protein NDU88_010301 [Pleurodeles waltl]|uniref:Uncharacterized protein n=1 Tax=Pleurodeles waltl TaxID=8319 RepID=A0AAV7RXS9_PLEWA|nr:hypothetical protein NDU88_010301 [Pleurodeles waltl]